MAIVRGKKAWRQLLVSGVLWFGGIAGAVYATKADLFWLMVLAIAANLIGGVMFFFYAQKHRREDRRRYLFLPLSVGVGIFLVMYVHDVPAYWNHEYQVVSSIPTKVEHGKRSTVYVTVGGHQFRYDERELPLNPYDYRFEIHYLPWTKWRVDSSITIATR